MDHGGEQESFFLAVVTAVTEFAQKAEQFHGIAGGDGLACSQRPAHAVQDPERGQDSVVFVHEVVDSQTHGVLLVESGRYRSRS